MVASVLLIILGVVLIAALSSLWTLRKQMRELQADDRMQKAFLQNIGNEIQVPLKVFHTLAATISQDDLYLSRNEKRNMSDQLNYNSDLIRTLLDEVLVFAGIRQSGHQLWLESFSPNALCRRCLEANQNSIYHRQAVKLLFHRGVSEEFFIKSDRHLVELIVSKLVINACKFTEQGEITVGCNTTEHRDCLTIFVADTGDGIPANRLSSLFSYFENHSDLANEAELDLSICKKVADILKGNIQVDENYSGGTRIKLILPLR